MGKTTESFVLKVNNGFREVLICKDKSTLDIETVKQKYSSLMHGMEYYQGNLIIVQSNLV